MTNELKMLAEKLRLTELENSKLMTSKHELLVETNRKLQLYRGSLKQSDSARTQLQADHDELKQICVTLGADRDRIERLNQEWKKFGQATVQEISTCKQKVVELEDKQHDLVQENIQLRGLCEALMTKDASATTTVCASCGYATAFTVSDLASDAPGGGGSGGGGDNASVSTNDTTDSAYISSSNCRSSLALPRPNADSAAGTSQTVSSYVKALECKIRQLESRLPGSQIEEPFRAVPARTRPHTSAYLTAGATFLERRSLSLPSIVNEAAKQARAADRDNNNSLISSSMYEDPIIITMLSNSPSSSKPDSSQNTITSTSLRQAQEQLNESSTKLRADYDRTNLSPPEKAIIRQMCNIVRMTSPQDEIQAKSLQPSSLNSAYSTTV